MDRPIRVSVIDERRLFREALAARLSSQSGIELTVASDRFRDVLDVARTKAVDVVLIDFSTSGHRAVALIWDIKSYLPDVRVIVLGIDSRPDTILKCVEAGAAAYTAADTSYEGLLQTIQDACTGRAACSPDVLMQVMGRIQQLSQEQTEPAEPDVPQLSRREVEIVKLIALGLINKEISQRLGIKVSTVKNHVHNILQKLQVSRRKQTVERAYELGILED